MSELTQCNYCNLKEIKRNKPKGSKVRLVRNQGWLDCYVIPKGERLDTRQEPKTLNHLSDQWNINNE